ncbi:MAG TPA: acyl-CoA dehydrogenase family protein [Candidatus Anoxymicrobiaceae bacterium]
MDFDLTDSQVALRDDVREFCESERLSEIEAELDRTGEFPEGVYQGMAARGLFGVPFAEEYGGSGGNILDVVIIVEQLAQFSNTAVNMFLVPVIFGGMIVAQCATDEQKADYLPRLVRGELKFSFSLTEPDAGSDPRSIKTVAVEKDGGYLLSGTKYWTTGANIADILIVVALTDTGIDPSNGTSVFLVPRDSAGLTISPIPKLAGEAYPSCEVVLDEVAVPAANIVGGSAGLNNGWMQLLKTADLERICVAGSCVGGAEAVLADCSAFAKTRVQFDRPIIKFQAIQHTLAEMATRIDAMRWMTYHAAWLRASGRDDLKEACMAKLFCSESLGDIVRKGMQVMGGRGYSREYAMQRYLRESYLSFYAGGTSEIQKSVISRFI